MTKADVARLVAMLNTYYPRSDGLDDDRKINAWYLLLQDVPADAAVAALLTYVSTDTKGFSPTVGQLTTLAAQMGKEPRLTASEAWSLVSAAIRNGYYGAEQEYAALPPECQRIVGSPAQLREWADMPSETVQSVVASHFQRSYREREETSAKNDLLPARIQALIAEVGKRNPELPAGVGGIIKQIGG